MLHHFIDFEKSIIDELFDLQILNNTTYQLLKIVMKHHGYIAGGFASFLAQTIIANGGVKEWSERTIDGVGRLIAKKDLWLSSGSPVRAMRSYLKNFKSDIDVWFENDIDQQAFFDESKSYINIVDIIDGIEKYAIDYVCYDENNSQKIQVVKRLGKPEEIFVDFDFYNAMCYITHNKIFVPDQFEWLCEQKLLHINHFEKSKINLRLKRMKKWMQTHDFCHGLTPSSMEIIVKEDVLEEVIKYLPTGNLMMINLSLHEEIDCIKDEISSRTEKFLTLDTFSISSCEKVKILPYIYTFPLHILYAKA